MYLSAILLLLLLVPGGISPAVAGTPSVWNTPTIGADTTWEGEIVLRENVVVSGGSVLRVLSGTTVYVENGKGIGITVLGRLDVQGKEGQPVRFVPEKTAGSRAEWEGIRLSGDRQGHLLSNFRIEGAKEGISLTDTKALVTGGVFSGCEKGVSGYQKSTGSFDNCVFEGNDIGAVISLGGSGRFRGCRMENILKYGIVADRGAAIGVSGCTFSQGKTGIFSLTNAPCRIAGSDFLSLEKGIVARQMGKESNVSRCTFENNVAGILAVQFCFIEISDSSFKGNQVGVDAREFSAPRIHHNRFESNQAAVTLVRKTHARVEKNVFFHNRNCVVVNYSSYPLITGNNFDRNDMSVRLEKFQSGDWEERAGSPKITAEEAAKRGMMNRPAAIGQVVSGDQKMVFPKRVNAKGNFWGPDADRDPVKGTLGKIWDGKKFGPVRYEGFGKGEYAIDVVDFSEESPSPFPDAGPRKKPGSVPSGETG
jgi:parallel beta-helix repeat protein